MERFKQLSTELWKNLWKSLKHEPQRDAEESKFQRLSTAVTAASGA